MVATHRLTIQEFEAMPLEGSWELIDGELREVSPTAEESSNISAILVVLIGQYVLEHNLGRIYTADGGFVLFPDRATVRAPDVAFVRADRIPRGDARKRFARVVPDLVVEVLSPTDRPGAVVAKVELYREAGVPLIWLVDPDAKSVTVVASEASVATLHAEDTLEGGAILPGSRIPVTKIFSYL